MTGEIHVRPARAEDAGSLASLVGQLGYDIAPADAADRLATMVAEGREVFVVELGGTVVGCLSTSLTRVLHRAAPIGRISMMVVEKALRGRGLGAALVSAAEEALAAQGCATIEVTSNERRTAAHGFYEKLGYERTSVRLVKPL